VFKLSSTSVNERHYSFWKTRKVGTVKVYLRALTDRAAPQMKSNNLNREKRKTLFLQYNSSNIFVTLKTIFDHHTSSH